MSRYKRRAGDWLGRRQTIVRSTLTSAVQVGVAAGVAWWLALLVLPWDQPLYAPIAAVVAIGAGENRMAGTPLRLMGGMLAAVAVAGVAVSFLGSGAWQIVVITILTTITGRFLFDDLLARSYAAFHGAVIGAMGTTQAIPEQIFEAAIGSVIGVITVHLVLPPRLDSAIFTPIEQAGDYARRALRAASTALRTGDRLESGRAIRAGVGIEALLAPDDQRWTFARQLARLSPMRWGQRHRAEELMEADRRISSILLDIAGLARLVDRLLVRSRDPRPQMAAAMDEVDAALRWMLHSSIEHHESEQVAGALTRLRRHLKATEDGSPAGEMLCENLRELAEEIEGASRELAG